MQSNNNRPHPIMLSVIYADCHIKVPYAECRYAEFHYTECRYAECHGALP